MAELIHECIVCTADPRGRPHLAPMGVRYQADGGVVLMPFRPSTTLDNLLSSGAASLNVVTDSRIFAGCLTGRRDWPLLPMHRLPGWRLAAALRHQELALVSLQDDPQRPVLQLRTEHSQDHAPFLGFNRAQAAVLEAAVLVSRLHLLPADKVDREMAYLQIAIDKTAAPGELEAWGWLQEAVRLHREAASRSTAAAA